MAVKRQQIPVLNKANFQGVFGHPYRSDLLLRNEGWYLRPGVDPGTTNFAITNQRSPRVRGKAKMENRGRNYGHCFRREVPT